MILDLLHLTFKYSKFINLRIKSGNSPTHPADANEPSPVTPPISIILKPESNNKSAINLKKLKNMIKWYYSSSLTSGTSSLLFGVCDAETLHGAVLLLTTRFDIVTELTGANLLKFLQDLCFCSSWIFLVLFYNDYIILLNICKK